MAGGDEREAVVCDTPDQPESLTFRHDRTGRQEFWWLTGRAGCVSFTLTHLPDGLGFTPVDAGFHSRTEREGWSQTLGCWFLDDVPAWCQASHLIGERCMAAYVANGEAGLQGALMALYDEWLGD